MASLDSSHPAYAGQAIYSPAFLKLYDSLAYGFNCPVLWRCRKHRFLEHYDLHLSARHLDIGVATGSLLDASRFPTPTPELKLMDLNPSSLANASRRLCRYRPRTHRANVLEPWGLPTGGPRRRWRPLRRDDLRARNSAQSPRATSLSRCQSTRRAQQSR